MTTTAITQVALITQAASSYGSMDVLIQATTGTERHTTKLAIAANSTNAISTEYATLITSGSLFTVDTDLNAGNIRVLITPGSATSTVFKATFDMLVA